MILLHFSQLYELPSSDRFKKGLADNHMIFSSSKFASEADFIGS